MTTDGASDMRPIKSTAVKEDINLAIIIVVSLRFTQINLSIIQHTSNRRDVPII
jgi:hypothetical protein